MFGLFGKKKPKEEVVRRDPAQKKAEAMQVLNKLKLKYQTDEERIEFLMQEIKRLKVKLLQEKKKKKPDKRVLTLHFNQWRLKEKQLETQISYQLSTQKQIISIETQISAGDMVANMKESARFIKMNQPSVEEVEDVTSDLTELMEDQEEVNTLIADQANTGIDEDEMEGLLNELEDEDDLEEGEEEDVDVDLPEPTAGALRGPELPDAPTTDLPAVRKPVAAAAARAAPARVAVAVGSGGGGGGGGGSASASRSGAAGGGAGAGGGGGGAADADEAELAAWFGD
jgi:hypothetical protein